MPINLNTHDCHQLLVLIARVVLTITNYRGVRENRAARFLSFFFFFFSSAFLFIISTKSDITRRYIITFFNRIFVLFHASLWFVRNHFLLHHPPTQTSSFHFFKVLQFSSLPWLQIFSVKFCDRSPFLRIAIFVCTSFAHQRTLKTHFFSFLIRSHVFTKNQTKKAIFILCLAHFCTFSQLLYFTQTQVLNPKSLHSYRQPAAIKSHVK